MNGACLTEDTVLAFVGGKLESQQRTRVERHLEACPACNDVLTWAAADLASQVRRPRQKGPPSIAQLAPGTRVERYQILGFLGRGGMGDVYSAYHPDLDRRIALKLVRDPTGGAPAHASAGASPAAAERRGRLLREARAIARLSHPNVIAVYDAGTVGDHVYLAMELIEGQTLATWLRAAPRSWDEVVDIFLAAGRGLAAAHAAGIVHRDFKPQNVMIGNDGAVRVMDFGLARLLSGELRTEETPGGNPNTHATSDGPSPVHAVHADAITRMTKTGALLGTPAYMAPEQFRGEPADARADQFGFCVTLHEALYGERPILAHLLASPSDATRSESTTSDGPLRPFPPNDSSTLAERRSELRRASVPSWLRRLLRRGLALEPHARFSSMASLLSELQRGRHRVRRRAATAASTGALAIIALVGWRAAHPIRFDCRPPADRITAAWPVGDPTHPRREAVWRVFRASDRPNAEMLWQRFASTLDDYLGQWTRTYTEACEATHRRGEQSQEVLDLRMRCLNENLDDVRALTDAVLSSPSSASSFQALSAATGLVPVSRCADLSVLRSIVPLPRDPAILREVQSLEQSVREIRSAYKLGGRREVLSKAYAIRPKVEATGYKPLLADLLVSIGILEGVAGDPRQAESALFDAVSAGVASGNEHAAAMAAAILVTTVGYEQGRHVEGRRWGRFARGLLDRLGTSRPQIESWVLMGEGAIDTQEHRFDEANSKFERAYAITKVILAEDDPDLAVPLSNLGVIAIEIGDRTSALKFLDRAIALTSRYGQPSGIDLNNRAEALGLVGRNSEARRDFERSIAAPLTDFYLAYPLTGLGILDCDTGQPAAAVPLLERALRMREAHEPDPTLVAETRFGLARALWESGGSRGRAISLARAARNACGDSPCPQRLRGLEAWLASHRN